MKPTDFFREFIRWLHLSVGDKKKLAAIGPTDEWTYICILSKVANL
jgi:hypothetical protein